MMARTDMTFFVTDTTDGRVAVTLTLPLGTVIEGPLQTLQVAGPGMVQPPLSPMTPKEFTAWRESLETSGFAVELRFAN